MDKIPLTFIDGATERTLQFERGILEFQTALYPDPFVQLRNNKSLAQTLDSKRFKNLAAEVPVQYRDKLDYGLGDFLAFVKADGHPLLTSSR